MRLGFSNRWEYNNFPPVWPESLTVEDSASESFWDREYERRFPSTSAPAPNNADSLAKFRAIAGITPPKVSKEVTRVAGMTRREETYARLAEKVRGNKWFDENA